ncbi:MAG TPA: hypothetical protein VGK73_27535 [Polyangiaceae bacterium]
MRGGVETFARNLELIFRKVHYMTPATLDLELIRAERLPVICDNQWVTDLPESIPAIGFQHGVAFKKLLALRERGTLDLARRQARAARRKNTLWVACARWVGETFGRLHGNGAAHIVHYPVNLERFDANRSGADSRLVLHDGRTPHKGSLVYPWIRAAFPDFRFEPLDCAPADVADRMRQGGAFLHLSSYEGNSVVCNEAMAMNLPCLFTEVGLMLDRFPLDVSVVPRSYVYGPLARLRRGALLAKVGDFLASLERRRYEPRPWVEANASIEVARTRWRAAMHSFDSLRFE